MTNTSHGNCLGGKEKSRWGWGKVMEFFSQKCSGTLAPAFLLLLLCCPFKWVLQVWQIRNEDAVFCRSSMSSSTTPFWRHVSAATPPFPLVSSVRSTMTWTAWTRRPTPAPSKRNSGWEHANVTMQIKRESLMKRRLKYKNSSKHVFSWWTAQTPSEPIRSKYVTLL